MTDILIPLPQYEFWYGSGMAAASALKIKHVFIVERGVELHFEDEKFAPTLMDGAWADVECPNPGQYLVFFGDAPTCFNPDDFEEIFTLVDEVPADA